MVSNQATGSTVGAKPRVLLVEDDAVQRMGMEAMLVDGGFEVLACANGQAALSAFGASRCDAAVLDLLLPDVDGVALTEQLRSLEPDLGVIIVTMNPGVRSAVSAMKNGAIDFLVKPISRSQLVEGVHNALQRSSAQRQARATQSAMAQKLESLQTVNAQLNEFAARVAHDLRSPVRATTFWIEFAREAIARGDSRDADAHLEAALKSIASGHHIIDGLLALSKSNHLPVQRSPIALSPLIHTIVESCRIEFRSVDYKVHISISDTVFADPILVGIAVSNVVHNAFKYASTRADPIVEICARPETQEHYVVLVRDNGVGIAPDKMDRLFVPFERLNSTPAFAGEGIGLTTVKQVMEKHGGAVRVNSAPDAGTTVELRFPQR